MAVQKRARITSQVQLAPGIFSMWLEEAEIAKKASPGQFLSLYCNSEDRLLPRPISICEIKEDRTSLRLVYRVAGKGTEEFSKLKEGDMIQVMGPLGNGFPMEKKKAILIGGGIGIPPMLELAKSLDCEKSIVLGYRDKNTFLDKEFLPYGQVYLSTEDGSLGVKGNVIDAVRQYAVQGAVIYACGPTPMLRGVKAYALEHNITAWMSLEERMACGIGACLACVCKTKEKDHHTNVDNTRICKEGPVFKAEAVEL
ncbi:dihydroorotate dehydrogenase electron transfer subunit [Anaerocolumna xylanovorans]|uniref:Dihydroorotate dehydrogenase B (NAD(+)), electron transfer subunit n=1 Tax=Anaerocolumna xylanovorans DSM 12503 TaxID=1121345 RepID=A0A1M7Y4H5_9FIRM|nr:dihydroorotate dehydrogenase electron transfer subunit [Anaerocolumna xylanovorans]SHO47051.1 dihydroorotate dehydrogenase electron transfer subunit [Anaerocolumna xylanovorans DSM 12503]